MTQKWHKLISNDPDYTKRYASKARDYEGDFNVLEGGWGWVSVIKTDDLRIYNRGDSRVVLYYFSEDLWSRLQGATS
jgi:hypothetical protein